MFSLKKKSNKTRTHKKQALQQNKNTKIMAFAAARMILKDKRRKPSREEYPPRSRSKVNNNKQKKKNHYNYPRYYVRFPFIHFYRLYILHKYNAGDGVQYPYASSFFLGGGGSGAAGWVLVLVLFYHLILCLVVDLM